ncbi:MAG: hypothetical protein M1820_000596 [Bogoriella megaspora]|nr:MAG: hypothetical protein M1820_000596 [Bogoriella megaspora]
MDNVDRDMEKTELDASLGAGPSRPTEEVETPTKREDDDYRRDRREALARTVSGVPSTSSSSSGRSPSSSISSRNVTHAPINTVPTQQDGPVDLERNKTALSRIHTARSQHSATVGAGSSHGGITTRRTSSRKSKPLPEFGGGKPYPPPLPEREEYVVEFDGPKDPLHAQNWPLRRKLIIATVLGFVTLTAAFGSSIFSAATRVVATKFGVSVEVGTLGVSLYVLGFATGQEALHAKFAVLLTRN